MFRARREASLEDFGEVLAPEEASEPILAKPVRAALLEWLTEIWAVEELAAVGLTARKRALFDGPPGVGKTTLAHHLAARLGLTLVCVRPDRIIDCWLGKSAQNLGVLFDLAAAAEEANTPVILLFDEFDTIAAQRQHGSDPGGAQSERTAIVNSLLQRMDAHKGFIIAASNHGREIDQAVWRRFEIQIELKTPGQFERERILARYLNPFKLPRAAMSELAVAFETATPALMRQFCENMKRNIVVGPKAGWAMDKQSVIARIIASVTPHAHCGKPRLWSHGVKDAAIPLIPWPLSTEIFDEPEEGEAMQLESNVVSIGGRT